MKRTLFSLLCCTMLLLWGSVLADIEHIGTFEAESWFCDPGVGGCGNETACTVFYDNGSHWWVCHECGAESSSRHEAYCITPTTCIYCGYTSETIDMQSVTCDEEGAKRLWDDTKHWYACPLCNKFLFEEGTHWGTCENPTTCLDCGAENVTPHWTEHAAPSEVLSHNEYYHWDTCSFCGTAIGNGENVHTYFGHEAACGDPDTCITCGATGVYMESVDHRFYNAEYDYYDYYDEEYAHDQSHHWYYCPGCGEVTSERYEHSTECTSDANTCMYCEATDVDAAILSTIYK